MAHVSSRGGEKNMRMRVRAAVLVPLLALAAYVGVITVGPRLLAAPIADHGRAPELVSYRPEVLSRASTVTTQASSSPCSGCTATRVKLGALTLIAGFTLFIGGFALVGRRTEANRRREA